MFRDESKSVIRKAVAALTHKNKQAERSRRTAIPEGNTLRSRLSFPVEQDFDFNSDPQHVYLMRQLRNYPLEVQPSHELEATKYEAVCYLLRSNAIPSSFWTSEMISTFFLQNGGSTSQRAMRACVVATATAMLSRVRGIPSLKDVAHWEYGSALRLLNASLADIEEAKTIQTLSAVALLAVYEVCDFAFLSSQMVVADALPYRLSHQEPRKILTVGLTISMGQQPCSIYGALINLRPTPVFTFFCIFSIGL